MNAPMVGSWSVQVNDVRPFSIHGDLYYELHITRLDPDADRSATLAIRVPQHAVAAIPKHGDKLSITFLMGQVTTAKPID